MPLKLFGGGDRRKDGSSSKHADGGGPSSSVNDKELKGTQFRINRTAVTVERKIAEGGFAVVLLVIDTRTGRRYALKRQFIKDDPRRLEACKRECQIIKSLSDHKNIVTYVDSDILKHRDGVHEYLLLTEFYRHSVLALMNERLMASSYLSIGEVLAIFCDMCEAVSRLHHSQTPVIHRDLKVENILIDDRTRGATQFILCDFGSATTRVLSTATHPHGQVEEEVLKNTTLSYRAPEMIDLYAAKPITTKADIWALGVMLYKLCYFSLPFGESTLAIQNATFSFPETPEYPQELKALTKCLLEPDYEQRPDVFQVSALAFQLAGRTCPVSNLNHSKPLHISELMRDYFGIEAINAAASANQEPDGPPEMTTPSSVLDVFVDDSPSAGGVGGGATSTTVNPRLRPKGNPAVVVGPPGVVSPLDGVLTSPRRTPACPSSSSNPELANSPAAAAPLPAVSTNNNTELRNGGAAPAGVPPAAASVQQQVQRGGGDTRRHHPADQDAVAVRHANTDHRRHHHATLDMKRPHELGFTDLEEPPPEGAACSSSNPFVDQSPFLPPSHVAASAVVPVVAGGSGTEEDPPSLLSFSPPSSSTATAISIEIRSSAPQLASDAPLTADGGVGRSAVVPNRKSVSFLPPPHVAASAVVPVMAGGWQLFGEGATFTAQLLTPILVDGDGHLDRDPQLGAAARLRRTADGRWWCRAIGGRP